MLSIHSAILDHQLFDRLFFALTVGKPIKRDQLLAASNERYPELYEIRRLFIRNKNI